MNSDTSPTTTDVESPPASEKSNGFMRWHRRALGFCLVVFALELGLFLLIFPWRPEWELSWVPLHSRRFSDLWMSRYARGIVSGLGILNIYVALAELLKQLRSLFGEERH